MVSAHDSCDLADLRLAIDAGPAVRTSPWPTYDKGDASLNDADEAAVLRALRSRRLFRYDTRGYAMTEVGRFEKDVARFFGVPHALACSSGTTAIALGLMSAGLKPGDRVACPAFTFSATPSAIMLAGGVPVLIDVDENLHLDVADLERKYTPEMTAVVAVHMRGFACDVERIAAFCKSKQLTLVEDAVPGCGASLRGKLLGTFGHAGAFSTQSDKSINTGEGGFVLLHDEDALARAAVLAGAYERRVLHHVDRSEFDDLSLPLYSFRLDELRAALAANQLARLGDKVRRHREVYDEIAARMAHIPRIRVRQPVAPKDGYLGECVNFWLRGASVSETQWFVRALRAEGIDVRQLGDPDDTNVRCFWNWRFLWPSETPQQIMARAPRAARALATALDIPLAASLDASDRNDLITALTKVTAAFERRFGGAPPASVRPSTPRLKVPSERRLEVRS